MAVTTTKTNKPINPRGDDKSPLAFNRAKIYSGKALDFDGVNDYVDLDGFTMAGNVATIVFQANFSNGAYILDINTQRFVVLNNATNGLGVYDSNAWSYYGHTDRAKVGFYAIVSDGTTQRAYYNGHQLGEDKTIVAIDWDSITEMALGSNNNGTGNFFDGQIAGFKIFNTALTAAQVLDLYNNPEKIVPTGVSNDALKLWLPMMEGAGTTAYDGSGNGNHGTISGATWTHGIGAPVAQSAVIDWNKGTNKSQYSEDFDNAYWGVIAMNSVVANDTTSPDGQDTADKITPNATTNIHYIYSTSNFLTGQNTISVFAKHNGYSIGFRPQGIGSNKSFVNFDLQNGVILSTGGTDYNDSSITSFGDGWYRCSMTMTNAGSYGLNFYAIEDGETTEVPNFTADGTSGFYLWGAQATAGATLTPYVRTGATAQTSPVLLPQGLTSGRDITGVNLFENVRKQYALNLDGQSWAEVHDNESLDFGTGSFTLEAWVKIENINTGAGINAIFGLGGNATAGNAAYIETNAFFNSVFRYDSGVSVGPILTRGDWAHIVGVFDGTSTKIYSNGVLEDTDAATAVDITNSEVKLIGRDSAGTRFYKDQIAQPRIYNRALTADEVAQNYNAGKNTYS